MTIRCSQGHENADGSAFCDTCGERLDASVPVQQTAGQDQYDPNMPTVVADATSAPQAQPIQQSQAAPDMSMPDMSAGANAVTVSPGEDIVIAPSDTISQDQQVQGQAPVGANALQARLIVEADNQEFDLSGKDNIVIGREDAVSNIYPDVDLTPHGGEEGGVSRLHARIFNENGQYMVEDENSTNFTFVNRQRLSPKTPTPLHDNDEVRLGRVLMRFKTP
jgi:pSer/pThr/pTyr-binding forkhead associated (FHA) protein